MTSSLFFNVFILTLPFILIIGLIVLIWKDTEAQIKDLNNRCDGLLAYADLINKKVKMSSTTPSSTTKKNKK